jgi:outer membrane protein insertion porin family
LRWDQDVAGLGGDVHYLRSQVSAGYYYPVTDDTVLATTFRVGYVFGLSEDVHLIDRFFLGGNNFRGFATSGVGPRDRNTRDALGGNLRYVGGVELTFPMGLPDEYGIRGRVFSEAGSLTDIDESGSALEDTGNIRLSAGVGLSWRSPFGPIRLDFGFPIVKDDLDETEVFRFDFGTRF